jgi:hypothetical protein
MKTRVWQWFTAAAVLVFAASQAGAAEADDAKPEAPPADSKPAIIITNPNPPAPASPAAPDAAPVSVIPPKLSLPPTLDQVVRLSKSGADQSVIKAYIEKNAPNYRVSGNDIIDLQDQGVSKDIILALVEQSQTATPSTSTDIAAAPPATPPPTNEVPQVTAPLTPDAAEYYDALSPYGTWYNEPDYGWVWQPTAVVVNPLWRPYCDSGSWLWSDAGWYWNSYYSWGWAPFHYGRWWCSPHRGWLWCPDRVWGPSWVCWRNSAAFCGWAPLPPGACFTAGLGWTHWGKHVGADCNWGLRSSHFTHVAHSRFTDAHVGRHRLNGHDANTAFAQSRVINNFSVDGNNRMVNNGIGREQIAAARGRPIQQVSVSEAANRGNGRVARSATATASSFRNDGSVARQVGSLPNRTASASAAQGGSRTVTAPNNAPRAMSSQSFASRSPSASAQSIRGGNSLAMPRANNNPGVNTATRFNTAPRMNAAPQFQPGQVQSRQFQSGSQSRQTVVARGSFAPSAPSRSFAAQGAPARSFSSHPSTARPSSGSSFSGRSSFSGGGSASRGSMSVGRSGGGGGGGRR